MKKRHHGEIRRSQLVRTFGPGAMVDLPNHSVVVSGLDSWFPASEMPTIVEERLSLKVAAVLGHGIARNHPFIDGNKRTAFVAVELFLELNGHTLLADDADSVTAMLRLAEGSFGEEDFAAWVRERIKPVA